MGHLPQYGTQHVSSHMVCFIPSLSCGIVVGLGKFTASSFKEQKNVLTTSCLFIIFKFSQFYIISVFFQVYPIQLQRTKKMYY